MAEQLNKGVTIPFSNIGVNVNKSPTSRVPLDGQNTIVTLTKDTNTTNNREFKSALELAEYDIKVNHSADKLRDTEVYSSSNGEGTHYDRQLTLRDLGYHLSKRIVESIEKTHETYNINLRGKMVAGYPSDESILDAFSTYADTKGPAKVNDLNAVGDRSSYGGDDNFSLENHAGSEPFIGKITNSNATDFIAAYCDMQSGLAMGEAKVLNPDFQFNELDDVRSDFRRPKIGRLYSERIYDYNLPTVYFCPGKIEIKTNLLSLTAAFTKSQTASMTDYVKDTDSNAIRTGIAKMGNLFGSAVSMGAKKILDNVQWYKWTPLTVKYMKYVDEMLIQLAVWMGLIDSNEELLEGWQEELTNFLDNSNTEEKAIENINKTWNELFGNKHNVTVDSDNGIIAVSGYLGGSRSANNSGLLSVLTILPQYTKNKFVNRRIKKTNFIKKSNYKDLEGDETKSKLEASEMFIPFSICKGVSVSESFSNSVGEHPLTTEYNQQYEDSNQKRLQLGMNQSTLNNIVDQAGGVLSGMNFKNANGETTGGSVALGVGNMLWSAVGNHLDMFSNSEMGMVVAGAGRFVLPEIWTNSTFDRSYNITFKFRSPYGHRLSIFENTMVPLLFLISMTAPRAIGLSSYTNPFYIKAFSKGLFSCDLGMITSLSISRGEDKNDRTVDGFFRTVTASLSIKDMLPTMQLGLDVGNWTLTNSVNNGMIAYMCNLAGVDFIERANLAKGYQYITKRLKTTYEEFGSSTRAWLASVPSRASIMGISAKSFGLTNNPMKDRKYPKTYN